MKKNSGKKLLSDIKLYSDYLKWKDDLDRYETWEEACEDIINGHRQKYAGIDIEKELTSVLGSMKEMKVFASQRNLQFRYPRVKRSNLRLYNCSVLHAVNNNVFQNACYLLINGCGVGVSLLKPFVDNISSIKDRENGTKTFVIEDSMEGWADAFGVLMSSYLVDNQPFPEYSNCKIRFDYSLIRPNEAFISGGFKAPGSEPLKKSLEIIEKLLDNLINSNVTKLRPIHVFDIICHISDCILSGGVRRCLAKGSKVLTKNGTYKNIEDIEIGDFVKTLKGYQKVTNTFFQGKQETIKIIHQSGELKCTKNHKIATILENGSIEWKLAGDLTENDRLVFCLSSDDFNFNNSLPEFNYIKPLHSTTCKDIIIPELDNDIAYLIGLIQGDGYVRLTSKSGELSIAIENNLEKVNKVVSILKRFNVNPKIQNPTFKDNSYKVKVKSKQLALYLYQYVKQPKTELVIPKFILDAGTDIQKSYIAGIFCSDGCFKTRPVQACVSIYENFLKEIQCLLTRFGIHSSIKDRTYNKKREWNKIYSLNILGLDNFNNFKDLVSMSSKSNDKGYIIKANNTSILKPIDNMQPIKIKEIILSDYVETYDIEVENEHSFMCEGILVHNSALLMVVDPHDKEMIYSKTGNWRSQCPQRARSNNSVLLLRNLVSKEQFEEIVNLNNGDNDIGFIFGNSWFDMFNPCLSANSKILTNNGYVEISKLDDGLIHKIINKNGQEVDTKIRLTGYKPTINLHLSNNDLFTCTEDHRLIDCNNNEIEANNTKGIRLGIDSFCNNDFDLEYIKYGFLQGDGCLSRLSSEKHLGLEVNIGKKDLEIKELFNIHSDGRSFYLNSEDVKHKLIELEFSKETLPKRTLPKSIKSWTKKQKLSFLRGLWSANGSIINNHRISFKSSCKELIEELQVLLSEFNISSYYTTNKSKIVKFKNGEYKCKESYDLNISKINSMAIFSKFINFEQKYKQESLSGLIKLKSPLVRKITNNKGVEPVYDFEMNDDTHIGVVNNILTHNCAEIQFTPILTDKDLTQITYEELPSFIKDNKDMFGVQLCNLTSMNAERIKNKEDFLTACKDEAILGTLQAGYTDFPYFKDKTEELTKREALLGTSITGWMNNPKLFNKEWLQEGSKVILETNEKLAAKLGINKAARTTCVKPEGNLSVIAQTSSGFHPEHSMRYFRIMQINKSSDVAKYLIENCPYLLEESAWSANGVDYVIFVPVTNPADGVFKESMKGVKHLELIKFAQENWVIPGTRQECGISPKINHNISATVILDHKESVINYIWDNKDSFTAVSFISDYGDKDFNQAPFTSVLNVEEIFDKYGKGALFISGLIVDGLHYFGDNLWNACDYLINLDMPVTGTKEQIMLRKYWITRAKKFAKNYFKNDIKTLIYCLKDVHLYHKWESINREIKEVDFSKILKRPEYKNVSDYAAMACSGKDGCSIQKI